MTINYTTNLGLAEPVTGTEAGTWGGDVNMGITDYLDIAIAGSLNITTDADVTLTITNGSNSGNNIGSTTAQYMQLLCTSSRSTNRNINVPNSSKMYVVSNSTSGGYAIVVRGYTTGPSYTTGVTIANGEKCVIFWSSVSNDFIKITSSIITNLTGTLGTTNGGTGLTSFTANGVVYASSTSALATGSALTFDGTNFSTTGTVTANGRSKFIGASEPFSIYLRYNSSTNGVYLGSSAADTLNAYDSAGNPFYAFSAASAIFSISGSEQMRLTSTGLGIGTSSPGTKLHIKDSTNTTLTIQGDTGTGATFINLSADAGNTTKAQISSGKEGASGGRLIFSYANSSGTVTEGMRLDSSGNLGLGVAPSAWNTAYKVIQFAAGGLQVSAGNTGDVHIVANKYINTSAVETYYATGYATDYYQYSGAHVWKTAPSGTAGTAITFTQAMTLDASGNLLVGTTTGTAKLTIASNGASLTHMGFVDTNTSGKTWLMGPSTGTGAATDFGWYNLTNTTFLGRMTSGGAWFQGNNSSAWSTTSDARIKTNIETLTGALSKVLALRPVEFDNLLTGKRETNFIAQEYEQVIPAHVVDEKASKQELEYCTDGTIKRLNANLIPYLVASIQELKAEFDAYKASHP